MAQEGTAQAGTTHEQRPVNHLKQQMVRASISAVLIIVAVALLLEGSSARGLVDAVAALSFPVVALAGIALLAGALLAALRLKLMASDLRYDVDVRTAIAATSAGQLAGALFFQIFGQLLARAAFLGRTEAMVLTVYERIAALLVSVVLAAAGAIFVFGHLSFSLVAGGAALLKLAVGLIAAVAAAGWVGWGRMALAAVPPISASMVKRFARCLVVSLAIQLTTMAAYVIVAHHLAPDIPLVDLAAASALVMFAASLPISLAGWGIREMSAVVALGAIGLPAASAFVTAFSIGIGSIVVVGFLALLTAGKRGSRLQHAAGNPDYDALLDWGLPLVVGIAVLFQAFVPTASGTMLNVNLADPFAIIAGGLMVLRQFAVGKLPPWRLSFFNAHVALASAVLTLSLVIGIVRFGWTDWAFINKWLGWCVLMSYFAAGAMVVARSGEQGLLVLCRSFAAAGAAIVAVELCILLARNCCIDLDPASFGLAMAGFSQNRNSFAFMLLLVIAATLVARPRFQLGILALSLTGLLLAGSRAAYGTLVVLVGLGLYLRVASIPQLVGAIGAAALTVVAVHLPAITMQVPAITMHALDSGGLPSMFAALSVPGFAAPSSMDHLRTVIDGFRMFLDHPVFGAGLGAYMHMIRGLPNDVDHVIASTPVWLLAETGVVGFAVMVIPVLRIWIAEMRAASADAAGNLIVIIIATFGTMSLVHELMYQRAFWLLFGAALAVPRMGSAFRPSSQT